MGHGDERKGKTESNRTDRANGTNQEWSRVPSGPGKSQRLTPAYRIGTKQDSLQFRVVNSPASARPCPKIVKEINLATCLLHNHPPPSLRLTLLLPLRFLLAYSSLPSAFSHHLLSSQMSDSPIPDDSHNNPENSSPSDFHSSAETSPAIIPLSEPAASDGGHSPSPTSTRASFQHRHSLDPQKVSAAGRGGCWCVSFHGLHILSEFVTKSPSPLGPAVYDEKYVLIVSASHMQIAY